MNVGKRQDNRKAYSIMYENRYRFDRRRPKKSKEWADKHGLKMQRAYTLLIRKGLKYEDSKSD